MFRDLDSSNVCNLSKLTIGQFDFTGNDSSNDSEKGCGTYHLLRSTSVYNPIIKEMWINCNIIGHMNGRKDRKILVYKEEHTEEREIEEPFMFEKS